jgi:nitrogen fixation/metabolism regulation signal transduction histidine kinase
MTDRSRLILGLLGLNLILILALAAVMGWRVLRLFAARATRECGCTCGS